MDISPIILSLQLASVTTTFLLVIAIPIAYWLAYGNAKWKFVIESFVSLPLVLPPTVLGFYLLVFFGADTKIGSWLDEFIGLQLIFSFEGMVIASIIYSLPFMVNPIKAGLSGLSTSYIDMISILPKGFLSKLIKIYLPSIKSSVITGIVLSFAHTIGEFGIVLMIGGSIPKETKVASIAIYEQVEILNYDAAHVYAAVLLLLSFFALMLTYSFTNKSKSRFL